MKNITAFFVMLFGSWILAMGDVWYSLSDSNNEYVVISSGASPYTNTSYLADSSWVNLPSQHLVAVDIDTNEVYAPPFGERTAQQKWVMDFHSTQRWYNTTTELWEVNSGVDTNARVVRSIHEESDRDLLFKAGTIIGIVTNDSASFLLLTIGAVGAGTPDELLNGSRIAMESVHRGAGFGHLYLGAASNMEVRVFSGLQHVHSVFNDGTTSNKGGLIINGPTIVFEDLPTSTGGMSRAGTLWNNSGALSVY